MYKYILITSIYKHLDYRFNVPTKTFFFFFFQPTFSTHQLADYTTEYYQNNEV